MSDGRPRVDVGIVTWNTREHTLRAIEATLAECATVDVRVFVRDNGSSDGTPDAVRATFPGVVVDTGDNVGFAAGVNSILRLADAPWFVTLNSDAWPEPGALAALVATAQRRPRAAAVAPLVLRPDGALEHSTHPLPSPGVAALTGLGLTRLAPSRARALGLYGAWHHDEEREVGWAIGAALLMRRAALAVVGDFDESLFMYGEDLDWCWRARRTGWEIWFTPSAVVRHRGNASGAQRFGAARESVAIGNANVVVRRHLGRGAAAAYQSLNAVGAARIALVAAARGDRARAAWWLRQVPAHLGRSGER